MESTLVASHWLLSISGATFILARVRLCDLAESCDWYGAGAMDSLSGYPLSLFRFSGALPHVKSASVFATHTAFCFFMKDRKAGLVLLNISEILCDVWSLKRLQRQIFREAMRS